MKSVTKQAAKLFREKGGILRTHEAITAHAGSMRVSRVTSDGTRSGHKSALEFVEAKQKRKVGGPMSDSRVIATRQATAARNLALRRVWRDGYIQGD